MSETRRTLLLAISADVEPCMSRYSRENVYCRWVHWHYKKSQLDSPWVVDCARLSAGRRRWRESGARRAWSPERRRRPAIAYRWGPWASGSWVASESSHCPPRTPTDRNCCAAPAVTRHVVPLAASPRLLANRDSRSRNLRRHRYYCCCPWKWSMPVWKAAWNFPVCAECTFVSNKGFFLTPSQRSCDAIF